MKILVVDDDDNIRTIAQMALEDDDIQVIEADSGANAIAIASTEQPDLILLDMMMPEMDGKTTCKRLKEQPSLEKTPVIFLTAKVQSHEVGSYQDYGAVGVISKPFDPMTLPDEINRILKAHSR